MKITIKGEPKEIADLVTAITKSAENKEIRRAINACKKGDKTIPC